MADSNQLTRDGQTDFLENDPFAELTRIMGHDPREDTQPDPEVPAAEPAAASEGADDFAFDLEAELLGAVEAEDAPAPPVAEASPVAQEPADYWRLAPEAAPEPAAHEEASAYWNPPEADPEPVAPAAPEEPSAYWSAPEATPAPAEPVAHDEASSYWSAPEANPEPEVSFEAAAQPYGAEPEPELLLPDFDLDGELAASLAEDLAPAFEELPPAVEPVPAAPEEAVAETFAPQDEPAAFEEDDWLASIDMDFGEDALTDAPPEAADSWQDAPAEAEAFPAEAPAVPSESADTWQDAPVEAAPVPAPPAPPSLEEELAALLAGGDVGAPQDEPVLVPTPTPAPLEAAPEPVEAAPAASAVEDPYHLDDEFLAAFQETEEPEPVSGPVPTGDFEMPLIETVAVGEDAVPAAGALDLPELPPQDEAAPGFYDGLDAEFAESYPEIGADPNASVAPAAAFAAGSASVRPAAEYEQWQVAFEDDLAAQFQEAPYAAGPEFSEADEYYEEEKPRRGRGVLFLALAAGVAVIGGAGLFAASYFGGGGDEPVLIRADNDPMRVRPENPGGTVVPNQDSEVYQRVAGGEAVVAPAQERLIASEEEPIDVAARGLEGALPLGVTAQQEPDAGTQPGFDDRVAPTPDEAGLAASEDFAAVQPRRVRTMVVRPDGSIVPREEAVAPAAAPPGASEAATTAEEALSAPLSGSQAQALADIADAQLLPAGTAQGEPAATPEIPDPQTPDTVNVVPSRPAPAAAPAAAPAQPQQVASAPVAAAPAVPAATPPAAAGDWSMQIASQPSAQSAQATYQDLARRYGGLLEGRGVNIVRAEIEGRGTYYRVRIPAATREEAIQLCTRYKAAGGSCFVSR